MGIRSRLVAATMAVATLTTVVGATTASASTTPAANPSASAPGKPGKPGGGDSAPLAKVAASLHVSVPQLTTALISMKRALGQGASKQAALAGFAKELGVSVARAQQALQELPGGSGKQSVAPQVVVRLLADKLHISVDRAGTVFAELAKVPNTSGDIAADPGFVAIAKSLGITPQRLKSVLIEIKQELVGKSAPGGSPTK
jgi:hypothetical protein